MSGLVPIPQWPAAAISVKEVDSMFSKIAAPRSPMPEPAPVIPLCKVPCSATDNEYRRTGTTVNRFTARKPLMAFNAACWILPRPEIYSIPHSKPETTRLTPYRAQPSWEKNRTTACTHSNSKSSAPILPIWAKKCAEKANDLTVKPIHKSIHNGIGNKIPNKH